MSSASKVGFYFYRSDWIRDTRVLTLEAKGAWIDLLCILHENSGTVTWPLEAYARLWSTSVEIAAHIIMQLEQFKTADVRWFTMENDGCLKRWQKLLCFENGNENNPLDSSSKFALLAEGAESDSSKINTLDSHEKAWVPLAKHKRTNFV